MITGPRLSEAIRGSRMSWLGEVAEHCPGDPDLHGRYRSQGSRSREDGNADSRCECPDLTWALASIGNAEDISGDEP